jgi:hypothetical protein
VEQHQPAMLPKGPCKSSPDARMTEHLQVVKVLQQTMWQAGPWQLRNVNGSLARSSMQPDVMPREWFRCGRGPPLGEYCWGPAHGPNLAPDAHVRNFKLAKEVKWLASLMSTGCDLHDIHAVQHLVSLWPQLTERT